MNNYEFQKLYDKYQSAYRSGDLVKAKKYLKDYIEVADRAGSRGTYYYTLEYLINEISMKNYSNKIMEETKKLGMEFKQEVLNCNFTKALIIAELQYELTDGKDFYSILHMAEACIYKHDFDKAESYINQAFEMNDHSPKAYATLIKYNIERKEVKEAENNLRTLKFLDKKNKYYYYLFRYEIACLTGNDKGLDNYFATAKNEITENNYQRLMEEKTFFDSRFKNTKEKVRENKQKDDKEMKKHLAVMSKFLEPDENNVVRPRLIFEYLDNLDLTSDKRGLYNLETAKMLATDGYLDLANKLIRDTEKIKNKSPELKDKMKTLSKEMRLIKYR